MSGSMRNGTSITVDTLLEFSVNVTLDGDPLTEDELARLLESAGGLVALKGKWVEVDRDKLSAALAHWKRVERDAQAHGVSFYDGMRLLAGAPTAHGRATSQGEVREWIGLTAGAALEEALHALRSPDSIDGSKPAGLRAELRHYQQTGVNWLRFVTGLGLGACLADDMGLGKTVQVIGLLLHRKRKRDGARADAPGSSLLVVPASLLANWRAELERFAPGLSFEIVHPSESATGTGRHEGRGARRAIWSLLHTACSHAPSGCGSGTGTSPFSTRPRRSRIPARVSRAASKSFAPWRASR